MRTLVVACLLMPLATWSQSTSITGVVTSASGPVAGATVRVQTTALFTTTNARGEFTLSNTPPGFVRLTGFAPGYYNVGPFQVLSGATGVQITLTSHTTVDNPAYEWLSAIASGNPFNCQNCHSDPTQPELRLPFEEWSKDAHGLASGNRRFLSMFNGTDLSGNNQSPPTRFFVHKDYGRVPLAPDPAQPYYGPGFRLDFPDQSGNCAACHAPNAAVRAPYDTDPNKLIGTGKEGIGCDLCHKTWDVKLDPATGRPYPNTPGVLSMDFRRPSPPRQLFLGPFDDVPGEDAYSPLQNQSRICAPCHFAQFWGVQIYNSFGEWLDSPYSDPVKGQTCQDCHMPKRGVTRFVRADKGGLIRDPKTIFSHQMPGAADAGLLRDTARLELAALRNGSVLRTTVTVVNEKAGHHIPTDHPSRNILLVVSARDDSGRILSQVSGPVIPEWGGQGSDPADYAGRPGRGFAKILEELWTERSPTAAYWNPTILREDTRIPALGKDVSAYEFRLPAGGGRVTVTAQLIFRRAFRALSKWKSWNDPDILMQEASMKADAPASGAAPLAVVSAASYDPSMRLAPDSIAAAFGSGLADGTVFLRDSLGIERRATLLFSSPAQINFVVPAGSALGPAEVVVINRDRLMATAPVVITPVAPGLFGAEVRSGVLKLLGTGFRAAKSIRVSIGGVATTVSEIGPVPGSAGLDQATLQVLPGLDSGAIVLTADGFASNPVTLRQNPKPGNP